MLTERMTKQQNLLEFFYDHVDEDDWLEGLDIYQSGRLEDIFNHGNLLTGNVQSNYGRPLEVRLKIHPSGKCVQWLECTCRKNRVKGQYCEHLAAFMISIDRDKPKFLEKLDSKMPLKAPLSAKKMREKKLKVQRDTDEDTSTAAETILTQMEGAIHSITLVGNGPHIRVKMEIKAGHMTHYDLSTDQSAKFIETSTQLKQAHDKVKDLKVYKTRVTLGTRITAVDDEHILCEKGVFLRHNARSLEKAMEVGKIPGQEFRDYRSYKASGKSLPTATYEFIPMKSVTKLIGTQYFFFPGRGYWQIEQNENTPAWHELPIKKSFKNDEAAHLVARQYEEYISNGPIFIDDSIEDPEIVEGPALSEIKLHSQNEGWFTLDPRYGEGTSSISMVDLIHHFRKKKRQFVKHGNSWVKIPEFIKEHDWDLDESGKFVKVDTLGLMRLKASVGDFDKFVGSKKLLNELRNQTEFTAPRQMPKAKGTNLDLREYQERGLDWLWWLYHNQLHGLLADEMGLGKTHQSMALFATVKEEKPAAKFLVIAPTTVIDHWEDKLREFCPRLRLYMHHGPRRGTRWREVGDDYDVFITSYGILLRDIKELSEVNWETVVLDEAHFAKNNDTATYRAICRLRANFRLCLTGTPMENNLKELKNIFDFLLPGYLGSDDYFKKSFLTPLATGVAPETELKLQKLIHPFKLRRTKGNVLKDLPAKVEDYRHCTLSKEQVKIYQEILNMKASPLISQLRDTNEPVPYLHVFATLTLLKQVCNHPSLLADPSKYEQHESGKFESWKELIEEALGSGHKIVIYSQYLNMIKIFSDYLGKNNIGHVCLTGQSKNRGALIKTFQTDPNIKVFCGSLLAGGIGIDLTAASVVIHYDRWWNSSKENQATDRVHRIGQNKNVQVIKMITKGTLEEKIDQLIRSKQELFEKFMDRDEDIFRPLSREELINLLT